MTVITVSLSVTMPSAAQAKAKLQAFLDDLDALGVKYSVDVVSVPAETGDGDGVSKT
jgi:hypothetical protein